MERGERKEEAERKGWEGKDEQEEEEKEEKERVGGKEGEVAVTLHIRWRSMRCQVEVGI